MYVNTICILYIKKIIFLYIAFFAIWFEKNRLSSGGKKKRCKGGKRETGGSNKIWEGNQAKKEIFSIKYER